MSLADALEALEASRRGPLCTVAAYLAGLAERDPALHARVVALLDDPDVSTIGLTAALRTDGATFDRNAAGRHRKRSTVGGCRCPR